MLGRMMIFEGLAMMIGEAKEQRDRMRARLLKINAELAEAKRAYVVDKLNGDLGKKVTLEAESAQLRYDLNQLEVWIHSQKKAEEALADAEFVPTLIKILAEHNLADLVREAKRRSTDAIHAAMRLFTTPPALESTTC